MRFNDVRLRQLEPVGPEGVEGSGRALEGGDLFLIAVLPVIIYFPVTAAWWLSDDPAILQHIIEFDLSSNFYRPEVWRAYSPANFTPLLVLSIASDLKLFGLSSFFYYAHQLCCVALSTALGFYLLSRVMDRWVAVLVVVLVLFSPPIAEISGSLMTRHYLDGLVLALVSVLLFFAGVKRSSRRLFYASAMAYLTASLAKEIYVLLPTPLLALLLGRDSSIARRAFPPFVIAMLVYGVWRTHMLGWLGASSGYGDLYAADTGPALVDVVKHLLSAQIGLGGVCRSLVVVLFALVGFGFLVTRRRPYGLLLFVGWTILAWTPIVFLFPNLADRYLLLPTIWVFVGAGLGIDLVCRLEVMTRFRLNVIAFALAISLLAAPIAGFGELVATEARERQSLEGSFTWTADSDLVLLNSIAPPWYHRSLAWMRSRLGDGEPGPLVCYDPCLCDLEEFSGVLTYEDGSLRPFTPDSTRCAAVDGRPMQVKVTYLGGQGVLSWRLEARGAGRWFMARAPQFFSRQIPANGTIPYLYKGPVGIQFTFVSDDGWRTSSPVLQFGDEGLNEGRVELSWARN